MGALFQVYLDTGIDLIPRNNGHRDRGQEIGKGIRTRGLDFDAEAVAPTIVVILTLDDCQGHQLLLLDVLGDGLSKVVEEASDSCCSRGGVLMRSMKDLLHVDVKIAR